MSLYNLVHGTNPSAGIVLSILGNPKVPRFRDAWIELHEGQPRLAIHTRTGGGNREEYADENDAMTRVEGYLCDQDDDFDSTYATFYYSVPEAFKPMVDLMLSIGAAKTEKPGQAWQRVIEELRTGEMSEQTKASVEAIAPIFEKIQSAFEQKRVPQRLPTGVPKEVQEIMLDSDWADTPQDGHAYVYLVSPRKLWLWNDSTLGWDSVAWERFDFIECAIYKKPFVVLTNSDIELYRDHNKRPEGWIEPHR